jgi:hypothetical protein
MKVEVRSVGLGGGEDFIRTWEMIVPRGPREIEED